MKFRERSLIRTETAAAPADSGTEELYCTADTEEDARKTAEYYGITLTSFNSRIALFRNDSGVPSGKLIADGMKRGGPPIAVNRRISLWDERPGAPPRKDRMKHGL